jgi:hypothetical protein
MDSVEFTNWKEPRNRKIANSHGRGIFKILIVEP